MAQILNMESEERYFTETILFLSSILRKTILAWSGYFKIKYNVPWCDKKFNPKLESLSNLKFKYSKFNSVIVAWNKMRLHRGKEFEI